MKRRPLRVLTVLLLLAPAPAVAQSTANTVVWEPSPAPPRLRTLPASTRAMALGGAYMMNAGHADVLFYHPALLVGASGFGLDVQRWGGEGSAASASAAVAWLGGSVGIGLQTLQAGVPGLATPRQDDLFTLGPAPVSERIATVGYARRLFGLQVGVAGKLVDERLHSARSSTVLVDVGVAREVGPLTVGLTVQDLGNDPFEDDGDQAPARLVLGAGAYGRQVGPLDMGFTASLTHSADETLAGAGVEVGYWPINGRTFVARAGVQKVPDGSEADPFTFGFAFWGDDLVLEWAYQGFGDLDEATHRFGVRWR